MAPSPLARALEFGRKIWNRVTSPARKPGGHRFLFVPLPDGSSRVMTEEQALTLSTVWACVTVIAKALGASSWEVFQVRGDTREPRPRSNTFRLLNTTPNEETTAIVLRESIVISALLRGNGYAEIERDNAGRAVALHWLDALSVEPKRDPQTRRLFYRHFGESGGQVDLPLQDVYHLRGPSLDSIVGNDMVAQAARTLANAVGMDQFTNGFFGNGLTSNLTIETDSNLNPEQIDQLRGELEKRHVGVDPDTGKPNYFKTIILGGGAKAKILGMEPEKAQLIESRNSNVEDVCRWFGVPPHKIAHLVRATFSNIEEQNIEFVRDALTPWAERLAQEANKKLLLRTAGMVTRVALEWLAEGNAQSRAEQDKTEVQNGLATINEVRRRRGRNPRPEGDVLIVQKQMVTLEGVKKRSEQPEPGGQLELGLDDPEGGGDDPVAILKIKRKKMNGHATH